MASGKVAVAYPPRIDFSVSPGATQTKTPNFDFGYRLLAIGHASVSALCGLYRINASTVQTIVNASSITVTMSNGTLSVKNNASSGTANCTVI